MTRRRLIQAACVAVVALGAAWWLFADHLLPIEQRLVGTWQCRVPSPDEPLSSGKFFNYTWEFRADRQFVWTTAFGLGTGDGEMIEREAEWAIRDEALVIEFEPSRLRRAARPLFRLLRRPCAEVTTFPIEWIAVDQIAIAMPGGQRQVWTRDRGD